MKQCSYCSLWFPVIDPRTRNPSLEECDSGKLICIFCDLPEEPNNHATRGVVEPNYLLNNLITLDEFERRLHVNDESRNIPPGATHFSYFFGWSPEYYKQVDNAWHHFDGTGWFPTRLNDPECQWNKNFLQSLQEICVANPASD